AEPAGLRDELRLAPGERALVDLQRGEALLAGRDLALARGYGALALLQRLLARDELLRAAVGVGELRPVLLQLLLEREQRLLARGNLALAGDERVLVDA